jgi:poly(A) polymerase
MDMHDGTETKPDLRHEATEVVRELTLAGFTAFWAGGCVRDLVMGRPPKDYDIATDATPDQVEALFPHTHAIGKAFGVIMVVRGDHPFEVATFRQDMEYLDGRRPLGIKPSSPPEDAQRRDFTINGMFYDPVAQRVIDYVDGRGDLDRRVMRAIGDPEVRFREDHLRMLRAVRFASTLQFEIEPQTLDSIRKLAPLITRISAERIVVELTRLLVESPRPGDGFALLHHAGLLQHLLPEALPMIGCEQPPQYHPEGDVWTHTCMMLNALRVKTPSTAWSVVFHDIDKPTTQTREIQPDGAERIRFNGHAEKGAETAERVLERMRASNALRDEVKGAVARHMHYVDVHRMRAATIRRILGNPSVETELELHRVDCLCSHGDQSNLAYLRAEQAKFASEPVLPAPWVSGHDLIALGIKPGTEVGRWKQTCFERQLNGEAPDREALLAWAKTELASLNR